MIAVLTWAAEHWFLIFLLGILGVFEGIRDFFVDAWQEITGTRHKRRMKELRARERIARATAKAEAAALPKSKPGLCVHRNVVPVVSKAEEVVAWLCRTCDTELPADWAVREEDL
jgi:hypothetical protein